MRDAVPGFTYSDVASGCSPVGSCTNTAHRCQKGRGGFLFNLFYLPFWGSQQQDPALGTCWTPPCTAFGVGIFCQISDLKWPTEPRRPAASSSLRAALLHGGFCIAFPCQPPRTSKCPSLARCLPCWAEREAVAKTQLF